MLDKLRNIVLDVCEDKDLVITRESKLLTDLKLNSLDLINLVCVAEDEFDIEIPDKKLKTFITVGDVIDYIQSQE